MSSLGTDGGGATYNSVSGDAVVVGPLLMAQHIEGIQLPPAAPAAPPSQGPPPTRVFVNRTEELAGLRDAALALAADPEPGVVMVVGVGGVGKTQLVAQAVRRELTRLFPDGQLYVDLEDHRRDGAVDLAAVLGGFLRALGVHKDYVPGRLAERTALFRSVAAPLRLLVKVDNVQHAPEARALVPPQGLLVVTGRRALPSLLMDGAVLIDVAPLDEAAGTELVRRWYADADEGTAADVVRLCAGHPLALRAAVEWLAARPQLTLEDVVRDLTAGRYGTGDDGAREAMGVAMGASGGAAQDGVGASGGPAQDGVGAAVDAVLDAVVAEVSDDTRHLYDLFGVLPGTTATADLLRAVGATRVDAGLGELLSSRLAVLVESADRPCATGCTMWCGPMPGSAPGRCPRNGGGPSSGSSWTSTPTRRPTETRWCSARASGSSRRRSAHSPNSACRNRCSRTAPTRWSGWTRSATISRPSSGSPLTRDGTRRYGGSASRCGRSTTAANTWPTASSRASWASRPPSTRRGPTSRSGCGTRWPAPPTSSATWTVRSPSSTPRQAFWSRRATRG
ncbi:hypothetical protein [Streptomyces microflavus]|uniref:hypothetical protein n=1 Tax=Streptomyces microflavus TaxID=1919 RepID=UPI0036AE07D0